MKRKELPNPYALTVDEALSLIATFTERRKKRTHTMLGAGFVLMGANCDLSDIKKALKEADEAGTKAKDDYIRLAGPNMRGVGHSVAMYRTELKCWEFIESDSKKVDAVYSARAAKIKAYDKATTPSRPRPRGPKIRL